MKQFLFINILISLSATFVLAMSLSAGSGEVKFLAVGKPGFLKIRGHSKDKSPSGSIQIDNGKARGEFEYSLGDLSTELGLRDDHMKNKYLEVGKFPMAKVTFDNINIKDFNSNYDGDFNGQLTLHGVTKSISGKAQFNAKDKKVTASFTIKVSDFQIDIPKHLGVTMSETVDVETFIQLK